MTLRRMAAALPLAVSVAVVAHVVGFGADHAPGGGHAAVLLGSLAAALVASFAWAFGASFFGRAPSSIATRRANGYLIAALISGGTLAFVAMEAAEGHLGFTHGTVQALLALVPAALLVALCARSAGTSAERGGYLAARRSVPISHASTYVARRPAGASVRSAPFALRATRGRAPPLPA